MKKAVVRGPGDTVESIDARLDDMGRKMDRLRALYESFFLGIERTPPNVPRRELNRLMIETQQTPIGNATLRFRFQSLQQRWVLYTTYWNRTLQEIEGGTYRRDLARAHRHLAARGGSITEQEALALGIPARRVKAFVGRQGKIQTRRSAAEALGSPQVEAACPPENPPGPQAPLSPGIDPSPAATAPAGTAAGQGPPTREPARLSPQQLATFYRKYAEAHVQALGAPPKATPDQLRSRLEKLLEGQSFERVELDVSVEAGKIRVRAKPVR